MTDLSPAAKAVLDVALDRWLDVETDSAALIAAAALRAVLDQVVPEEDPWPHYKLGFIRHRILTIADELENV